MRELSGTPPSAISVHPLSSSFWRTPRSRDSRLSLYSFQIKSRNRTTGSLLSITSCLYHRLAAILGRSWPASPFSCSFSLLDLLHHHLLWSRQLRPHRWGPSSREDFSLTKYCYIEVLSGLAFCVMGESHQGRWSEYRYSWIIYQCVCPSEQDWVSDLSSVFCCFIWCCDLSNQQCWATTYNLHCLVR